MGRISIQKVPGFRLELTSDGIGGNEVFVLEEDESEQIECVYTIAAEEIGSDPMMETFSRCTEWMAENNVSIGRYCYIRPLLISSLGNSIKSYLEVIAPLKK